MSNKLYALAAALTGCAVAASAVFIRQHSRRREARRQHKDDLRTWEGEGGKPAPVVTAAVPLP